MSTVRSAGLKRFWATSQDTSTSKVMETVCAWRDGRRKGKMRQIKKRIRKDADNYIHPSICETVIQVPMPLKGSSHL